MTNANTKPSVLIKFQHILFMLSNIQVYFFLEGTILYLHKVSYAAFSYVQTISYKSVAAL